MNSPLFTPHNPEPCLEHEIRLLAYCIYLQRGGRNGRDVDDWLEAERQVLKELRGHAIDVA